ncbi:hypothetical protein C1646_771028 [Rhizophagus diaphanus]|nr:hypothetical protein C1646_771028 [Rhizophagus diaphanus] [Rhizophagus sp. MUCL 43196]
MLIEKYLLKIINSQKNLKKISFEQSIHIYCCSLNHDFIQQINNIIKPFKLKSLFMDEILNIDLLQLLLQKSGDYLENIGFESSMGNALKQQLFDPIKNYYSKIKFIKLHGKLLPLKLEYLNLSFKIKTCDLEVFLKDSQDIFIKKLLINNKMQVENDDILPFIKKYIMRKNRVKYLAILKTFLNSVDLFSLKDEVKEFELYDIKIKITMNKILIVISL